MPLSTWSPFHLPPVPLTRPTPLSPVDDLLDEAVLLLAGLAEVEAGGLESLVAEKVGKEGEVAAPFKEILGEEVPEGMRMHDTGIEPVEDGEVLEPLGDTSRCEGLAVSVEKEVSAVAVQPPEHLCPELCGNVEPADLSALGADIDVSRADVLDAEPDEFADPCAGVGEAPDDEIPPLVRLPAEFPFESSVVFVGDDVVEERDFGHFDGFDFKFGFSGEFEVLVDAPDTDIDRFGLVGIDQRDSVIEEVLFVQVAVPGLEAAQGTEVGPYRVDGIVFLHQSVLERVKFHSVYKRIGFCKRQSRTAG